MATGFPALNDFDPILTALGAPDGTQASYSGSPALLGVSSERLANFPTTSGDTDFVILSSGRATEVTMLDNAGDQGTDLPPTGTEGDSGTLSLTIPVPNDAEFISLDFTFLSEEFPEFVGSGFNDFFEARLNGTNIALDINDAPITVNNNFFDGSLGASRTFFDGQTPPLRASTPIPTQNNGDPLDTVELELQIADVGDGIFDSAAFISNLSFNTGQVVVLNFEQAAFDWNGFAFDGTITKPGLSVSQNFKETVVQTVEEIYSEFRVDIRLEDPESGPFTEVFIGGDESDLPAALDTGNGLLGRAEQIDQGNQDKNDSAFVLTDNFNNIDTDIVSQVVAHELGHLLGLFHTEGNQQLMFPFAGSNRTQISENNLSRAEIGNGIVTSLQGTQNSAETLAVNVGRTDGTTLLSQQAGGLQGVNKFFNLEFGSLNSSLAQAQLGVLGEGEDVTNFVDLGQISEGDSLTVGIPVQSGMQIALAGKATGSDTFDVFSSFPNEQQDLFQTQSNTNENDLLLEASSFGVTVPNGEGEQTISFDLVQEEEDGSQSTFGEISGTVNDTAKPLAQDDSAETRVEEQVVIDVTENDQHPEDDVLDINIVEGAENGESVVNDDRNIVFTPSEGFVGLAAIVYEAVDNDGNVDEATLSINVAEDPGSGNNRLIVDTQAGDQTFTIGGADQIIQGGGNAETINVLAGTSVEANLSGGADRVNLTEDLSAFEISQQGFTGLQLAGPNGQTVDVSVNGGGAATTLAFAGGSVEVTAQGGTISVGGQALGADVSLDPGAVTLDTSDPSPIADGGGTSTMLPSLPPSQGGSGLAEVQAGTQAGDNIDADQGGAMLSGNAGEDRFLFSDTANSQSVTITDFEDGDQLFFAGGFAGGDVSVQNSSASDDAMTLAVGGTTVTLTNLPEADSVPITGTTSFEDTFSANDALAFA